MVPFSFLPQRSKELIYLKPKKTILSALLLYFRRFCNLYGLCWILLDLVVKPQYSNPI